MSKDNDTYQQGLKIRREVMGDAHVNRAMNNASEFSQPLQDMVIRNAWGETWVRDGINRQTRSLVTIATLAALKASTELKGGATVVAWRKFRKSCCTLPCIAACQPGSRPFAPQKKLFWPGRPKTTS